MKKVLILGTLDTKGAETYFIKNQLSHYGIKPMVLDIGTFESDFIPDYTSQDVLNFINTNINDLRNSDRSLATKKLSEALKVALPILHERENIDGFIALGGSGGTAIATSGLREIPIGTPKVMISTMASGNTAPYIGTSDIIMMPSVVDVSGLNQISEKIFNNAVSALAGMVNSNLKTKDSGKSLIAASMFGLTTPAVEKAKEIIEKEDYEVIVFHATGTGGKTMERLIEEDFFEGVLDLTTTEWCDELFGGVLNAGPYRLEAASKKGIPQIVSLGALDMVNFGPKETVPKKYEGRNFYQHNPTVTLMRTNKEENIKLGKKIAEKLNLATKNTVLLIPLKGLSGIDVKNGPFEGKEENNALIKTIEDNLINPKVKIKKIDANINDNVFSEQAASELLNLLKQEES